MLNFTFKLNLIIKMTGFNINKILILKDLNVKYIKNLKNKELYLLKLPRIRFFKIKIM